MSQKYAAKYISLIVDRLSVELQSLGLQCSVDGWRFVVAPHPE
jgi:hypothetical protein